mgnify:CR=1 FL=1
MPRRSLPRSGRRARRPASPRLAALALTLALAGCVYSFSGGGLPRHIRSVAVLPFEQEGTAAALPLLGTDAQEALRNEFRRAFGIRLADEAVADAVIRGRIVDFQEPAPGVRPATGGSGNTGDVNVVQRQIQLTFVAEIYDQRNDRLLWEGTSIQAVGTYQPTTEQSTRGVERALAQLAKKVTDGARSQW